MRRGSAFVVGLDVSALDPLFKAHAQRGIGRYVSELKKYFEAHQGSNLRVSYFDHRVLRASGPRALAYCHKAVDLAPFGRATLRQQLLFPLQLAWSLQSESPPMAPVSFDAVHFPAHLDPPAWGVVRYAVTVVDLIPLVCADLYKANKSNLRFKFARWLELRAIKNASLVLAISENTARDVHRILHVPHEKIVVTPLGVDPRFFEARMVEEEETVRRRYGLGRESPVVLYVGGIDPRKNYPVLIEMFRRAADSLCARGKPEPKLLMVGPLQEDREYPRLRRCIAEQGVETSVIMPGYVKDDELLQLYALSRVFVFPSLYEGFGLPVLEAMAAGVPVVSSGTSSMPEVLGDAGLIVDPSDARAAAESVCSIIENEELARSLAERGRRRARLFTWQRTGDLTLGAYERLSAGWKESV